jgi:leucyl aminopeptidase
MKVTLSPYSNSCVHIHSDCLVILLTPSITQVWLTSLPKQAMKYTKSVMRDEAFRGESGQQVLLHRPLGFRAKRVYLCGLDDAPVTLRALQKYLMSLFSSLFEATPHSQQWELVLTEALMSRIPTLMPSSDRASVDEKTTTQQLIAQFVRILVRSAYLNSYHFRGYKTQCSPHPTARNVKELTIVVPQTYSEDTLIKGQLEYEHALNLGIVLAKDLAHTPANICTPKYLEEQAIKLQDDFTSITTEVLSQQALHALGMHAYLAVNAGSNLAASMPILHYHGHSSCDKHSVRKPIVIIGKGVTFDSGGITLKRSPDMHHMIYDMAGAACVLGLMKTIASLQLECEVIGILATAENSIDGAAYRPGDIIQTHAQKTVEVISTDAEGRMLLADAISYSQRYDPAVIIDIATLTGAAITTLGHHCSALFSNDDSLIQTLICAGEQSIDDVWPLPLWPEYYQAIESAHADMKNAGTNSPGAITAGCFLSHFANDTPWAHIDVAGTAFKHGTQVSATGRPIPLLLQYLIAQSNEKSSKFMTHLLP